MNIETLEFSDFGSLTAKSKVVKADTLSTLLSTMATDTIYHYINNVSYLKPQSDHALNLSIVICTDPAMTNAIGNFDSSTPECSGYIEALLVSTSDPTISEETTDAPSEAQTAATDQIIAQTRWMPISTVSSEFGFGIEYNNAPVVVHLYDWMCNMPSLSATAKEFNKSTKLYLKNEWFYTTVEDNEVVYHKSDSYSQLVPSNTEQVSDASRYPKLTADVPTPLAIITATDDPTEFEGYNVATGISCYPIAADQVNLLDEGIAANDYYCLYINDYSAGNEYKVKFTAKSTIQVNNNDQSGSSINIAGNGELLPEFEGDGTTFQDGKTYLVSIQAGMIQKLAEKTIQA